MSKKNLIFVVNLTPRSYKLGDPKDQSTTTGPVISAPAVEKINSHVQDALSKGAVISTPDNSSFQVGSNPQTQKGNFVAPIVLTNVNHTMVTMKEETFGPVMPIMKVSSDDEAVELMNDSDFGLTASVWTKDISRGEELIERIEAGTVFINRCDYPSPVSDPSIWMYSEYSPSNGNTRISHGLVGSLPGWDAPLAHEATMDLPS